MPSTTFEFHGELEVFLRHAQRHRAFSYVFSGRPSLKDTIEAVGVPHPDGYERDEPPSPEALAGAVDALLADRERFAEGARRRAVERFALSAWLDRHAALFEELEARRQRRERERA